MMRLLVLLMIGFAGNCLADWRKAIEWEDGSVLYSDLDSLELTATTSPNRDTTNTELIKVKVWELVQFPKTQEIQNKRFKSMMVHTEYDCEGNRGRNHIGIMFSSDMGGGYPVYVKKAVGDWIDNTVGSKIEQQWKLMCKK